MQAERQKVSFVEWKRGNNVESGPLWGSNPPKNVLCNDGLLCVQEAAAETTTLSSTLLLCFCGEGEVT